ncbi:MAG TPA: hypothetical protein PK445_07315 [Methanolinea sp.]|nr:hypothetical protein [Methanolinea sp.]
MTKKTVGNGVSAACKLGEIAAIVCATEDNGSYGTGLLARAIVCSVDETGLPGRCSL